MRVGVTIAADLEEISTSGQDVNEPKSGCNEYVCEFKMLEDVPLIQNNKDSEDFIIVMRSFPDCMPSMLQVLRK